MKILTKRNGIALLAVLLVLLVLTLFLPVMFTMSENATYWAMQGTDVQKASYLARSVVEMAVATFKTNYEVADPAYMTPFQLELDKLYGENKVANHSIKTQDVEMYMHPSTPTFTTDEDEKEEYKILYKGQLIYINGSETTTLVDDAFLNSNGYEKIGTGSCVITYDDKINYYLINNTTQEYYPITVVQFDRANRELNPETNSTGKLSATTIRDLTGIATDAQDSSHTYSTVKQENKNVVFNSTATVNGKTQTRSCIVVLPTYPAKQQWLLFQGTDSNTGRDVFANPEKATGRSTINYSDGGLDVSDYKPQVLLTFACVGNMVLDAENLQDKNTASDANGNRNGTPVTEGRDGYSLQLGVAPGLNTLNKDPEYKCLKGVNTAAYYNTTQRDNFVAFTATNTITVDYPVNLFVNPTRGDRLLGDGNSQNYSIFKTMIFQAQDIIFNQQLEMMCSFYVPPSTGVYPSGNRDARRMSTVVLSAPATTKYSYRNDDRGQKEVKAGRVFFAEDCYVYVINYGDTGSGWSDNWYEGNQTVYYKDKDFVKLKVASAGDVCLFNTEVKKKGENGKEIDAAFSITGYAIETIYYDRYWSIMAENMKWWEVWTNIQAAMFGAYITLQQNNGQTYVGDDLHKIGNIYDGTADVVLADSEELYTIWSD